MKTISITFYYKDGCWLCDATEEMLNGLKVKHGLDVKKVSIESSDDLYEMYRFDIPVLEFEDGTTLHSNIKKKALLNKVEEMKSAR